MCLHLTIFRTDNAVKNQFYSKLRRVISKLASGAIHFAQGKLASLLQLTESLAVTKQNIYYI